MSLTDLIGIYGAVVGTAVAVWQWRTVRRSERTRIRLKPGFVDRISTWDGSHEGRMIRVTAINDSNHAVRISSLGFHCADGRVAFPVELRPVDQHEISSRDSKSIFIPMDEEQARVAGFVLPLRVEAMTATGLTFDSVPQPGPVRQVIRGLAARGWRWLEAEAELTSIGPPSAPPGHGGDRHEVHDRSQGEGLAVQAGRQGQH